MILTTGTPTGSVPPSIRNANGPLGEILAGLFLATAPCPDRAMDPATLFMVLTLPNGTPRTLTEEFPTLQACQVQAASRQQQDRTHPRAPGAITAYRCEEHKIRPTFYFFVCAATCQRFGPLTRHGCTAHKWSVWLQNRGRTKLARCIEHRQDHDRWKDGWSE
jgi:hypothetical protein